MSLPINATAVGIGNVAVTVSGPNGFEMQRAYTLAAKPSTQILTRRTVRPIARNESISVSSDLFADLVPGTGGVQLSVGPSTALDVAALLKALDRYPFGCTEQTTSRALPLLYVNELASEAHLSLDAAIDQRIRDAIERVLARQGSNGSFGLWGPGGGDMWLDAYVTDFLTRARERNFAVPDVAFRLALDHLRNHVSQTDPAKEGGSDLAYVYYVLARNGTAPLGDLRYLADTRLDALKTPIAKAQLAAALGMLGDKTRAERVYNAALEDIAPQPKLEFGRTDYGSSLRDASAFVALASEGSAPRRDDPAARSSGSRRRARSRPTPPRRRTPGWCWPRARSRATRPAWRSTCGRDAARAALSQLPRQRSCRRTDPRHQQRRQCRAGGGLGHRRAGDAGARGRQGLLDRAALLHARRRACRDRQGEAERALRRGAEDHRRPADLRPHHHRGLSAGRLRDRQSAAGVVRRYRHAVVDRGRQGPDALRIPR